MPSAVVLIVGLDLSLLGTRSQILQSARYMVASASSVKEVVDRFQAGDFGLIILCHSMPTKDREPLTCLVAASDSLTAVVSIAKTSSQHDAFPTATLDKNDTNEFLANLREILRKGWSDAVVNQPDRCGGLIDKDGYV
jgi:CheY-like chemotaxis protein